MGKTTIEWCTDVWNPVTGCTKVSAGCKNCYAERVFPRAYGSATASESEPGAQRPARRVFTDVRTHLERLGQPLRWRKPRRIFVNSMSDLFHEAVPDEFIARVFSVMAEADRHTFQILTKRPERMAATVSMLKRVVAEDWERFDGGRFTWPLPNIWLGVSAEDQSTADQRIPLLLQTPAAVRFVSYEPALGPVDFTKLDHRDYLRRFLVKYAEWCAKGNDEDSVKAAREAVASIPTYKLPPGENPELNALTGESFDGVDICDPGPKLDWLICGGESGPQARPAHPDWFRSVRDQCIAAGVPYFFKQWGEWSPEVSAFREMCIARRHNSYDWNPRERVVLPLADADGDLTGGQEMWRVGKKAAGRLLDGREWNEFPLQVLSVPKGRPAHEIAC